MPESQLVVLDSVSVSIVVVGRGTGPCEVPQQVLDTNSDAPVVCFVPPTGSSGSAAHAHRYPPCLRPFHVPVERLALIPTAQGG